VPLFYGNLLESRAHSGAGVALDEDVLSFGSHHIPVHAFDGHGTIEMLAGLWSFDPLFCVLALAGIVLTGWSALRSGLARDRRRDLAVVLAFALPYAIVFGAFRDSYSRFALPLVPVLAIPAAHAFLELVRIAAHAGRAVAIATATVLALCAGAGAIKLAWLRAEPDSVERAAHWTRTVVRSEHPRLWLQPGLELPLVTSEASRPWNALEAPLEYRYLWTHYLSKRSPSPPGEARYDVRALPHFHEPQGDHFTADPSFAGGAFDGDLVLPAIYGAGILPEFTTKLMGELARRGELLAHFAPIEDGARARPLMYDVDPFEEPSMLASVLRARCLGPVIDVFRIGEPKLDSR
jgi:hypothetical protein